MKKYSHIYFVCSIALIFLLLGCMLFYPFGYDQSVFAVGGDTVLKNGAIPGWDFLDTKPPLIFYIYAIALWLFGHHQWSIRALDVFYHIISLSYFFAILNRIFKNKYESLLIVSLYILLYVTSGYWMTAQAESFALLPSLIILDFTLRYENLSKNIKLLFIFSALTALSIVSLILLKYTLGFVLPALAGYILFNPRKKLSERITYIIFISGFTSLFLGLYILYLQSIGSLDDTLLGIQWVSNYAAIDPLLSFQTIRNKYFLAFPESFISAITPFIFVSFFTGILFRNSNTISLSEDNSSYTRSNFYSFCLWQCALGLLSIILERKNFSYQYARILYVMIPFIVIGIRKYWEIFCSNWKTTSNRSTPYHKIPIILTLCAILFFSPLTKLISQPLLWTWITVTGGESAKLSRLSQDQYYIFEFDSITQRVLPVLSHENDHVLFWGNSVEIYFQLNKVPTTICLTNTPLVTPWTPQEWKNKFILQLYATNPKIIIIEQGDERPKINGTLTDSFEAMMHWDSFFNFIMKSYHEISGTIHFRVFQRNI